MSPATLDAPLLAEQSRSESWPRVLGWAAYLACSWTWCIGMYLPVLLVRDYGIGGWIVFAAPNVIGAAAMGWVMRTQEQSRRLVDSHVHACLAFSLVTLAFHVFFLTWFLGGFGLLLAVPLAALAHAMIWGFDRRHENPGARDVRALGFAAGVLLLSLAAFGYVVAGTREFEMFRATDAALPLLALTPVSVFGFLFCPYLDLTFHRARQATSSSGGKLAFGLGFGVLFLLMIVFTLVYTPLLISGRFDRLFIAVGVHMAVQSAFTMAVHYRAMDEANPLLQPGAYAAGMRPDFHPFWRLGRVMGWIVALALGLAALLHKRDMGGLSGEAIYRSFMAFYGLVFPAYVWLCMVPTWPNPRAPTRRMWLVFAIAVLAATPTYWMGFIERRMFWLLPGVTMVLLARLALPRSVAAAR